MKWSNENYFIDRWSIAIDLPEVCKHFFYVCICLQIDGSQSGCPVFLIKQKYKLQTIEETEWSK